MARGGTGNILHQGTFCSSEARRGAWRGNGGQLGECGRRACAYSGSGPQLWGGPWLDLASTEALHEQESWRGRTKLPALSPQVLKGSVADGRCSAVVQPPAFLISSLRAAQAKGPALPLRIPCTWNSPRTGHKCLGTGCWADKGTRVRGVVL